MHSLFIVSNVLNCHICTKVRKKSFVTFISYLLTIQNQHEEYKVFVMIYSFSFTCTIFVPTLNQSSTGSYCMIKWLLNRVNFQFTTKTAAWVSCLKKSHLNARSIFSFLKWDKAPLHKSMHLISIQ